MLELSMFRGTGCLTLVCRGAAKAPSAIDLGSGLSVTLKPAQVLGPEQLGIASVGDANNPSDVWWGDLPMAPDRVDPRIALVADGKVRGITVHLRPEPAPAPQPPRKRRPS